MRPNARATPVIIDVYFSTFLDGGLEVDTRRATVDGAPTKTATTAPTILGFFVGGPRQPETVCSNMVPIYSKGRQHVSTNLPTGPVAATESSAYPALSLAADSVSFQAVHTVAADHTERIHWFDDCSRSRRQRSTKSADERIIKARYSCATRARRQRYVYASITWQRDRRRNLHDRPKERSKLPTESLGMRMFTRQYKYLFSPFFMRSIGLQTLP